jgi:hypothetical protein
VRGGHGDHRRAFVTILDNILAVGESAGSEERSGQPHLHQGNLPEGVG